MTELVQHIVNWLALGSIYALLALGIAVVFSVLGLINFAHGELVTISGYSMVLLAVWGVPWVLIIPLAVLSSMLAAVLMERVAYRPLRGTAVTTTLLASLALSIVIQNLFLMFVGARPETIPFPVWTQDTFAVGGIVIRTLDVLTMAVTAAILFGLLAFLRRSVRGIALRAAAENFDVTRLMGIRANALIRGAFAVSGLLAGVAAFFFLGTASLVAPNSGFVPLLKGFIAAVIGGLGSLSGAVIGGFVLAGLEIALRVGLPGGTSAFIEAFIFGIVIIILFVRPHGLRAERAALVERA